MSSYTIGEVARRSGFSASALRYYEGIALVEPTTRTGAGYRVYDDRALTRLALIARAKQLGCSLDEIFDLLSIGDGSHCGPVQRRLHDLATDKIHQARRQVAELSELEGQRRAAAAELTSEPLDGPCGEECACLAASARASTEPLPASMVAQPPAGAIACTLQPGAVPERVAEWRTVLGRARDRTATPDGGVRIEFVGDVDLVPLARLVAAERRCCAFLSFAITADDRGLAVEVRAPAGAAGLVAELFGP